MESSTKHLFATEYDCVKGLTYTVDASELLADIKVLMKEYYVATFCNNGNSLKIAFNNGQSFCVTVLEMTAKK